MKPPLSATSTLLGDLQPTLDFDRNNAVEGARCMPFLHVDMPGTTSFEYFTRCSQIIAFWPGHRACEIPIRLADTRDKKLPHAVAHCR